MALKLTEKIVKIINDPGSIKVLTTIGENGEPHLVFKDSIKVNEKGYIKLWELIESSKTNQNLVYSIWNRKTVAINVLLDGKSYQVKGRVYRAVIYGKEFEPEYIAAKEQLGADLSTVWIIEPIEVIDETLDTRMENEKKLHPLFTHLDQIG